MPELPDVEVFRRYFDATSLHRGIESVRAEKSILEGVTETKLAQTLTGKSFTETRRHGKYLFAGIGGESMWLVIHFGMTGYLKYYKSEAVQPSHTRMRIFFDNGYQLAWDCRRKLGRIQLVSDIDSFIREMALGIDALSRDLDFSTFKERICKTRGYIKSTLMNQSVICGIGNVYADEILYHARIHPKRKLNDLFDKDLERIFEAMGDILNKAIDAKAAPENMPPDFLLVRRGTDNPCACGGLVEKIAVAGRNGYYCPKCQK